MEVRCPTSNPNWPPARGELETLEATRRDQANQAEDGIEGAQKRLDATSRHRKVKRRIETWMPPAKASKPLTDQQVRDQPPTVPSGRPRSPARGKLRHAPKGRRVPDALRDATDELTDRPTLSVNLPHPAPHRMAERFRRARAHLGARRIIAFGLKRMPFAADRRASPTI